MLNEVDQINIEKDAETAMDYFNEIVNQFPANLKVLEFVGNRQLENNMLEAALETFTKITEVDPEYQITKDKIHL